VVKHKYLGGAREGSLTDAIADHPQIEVQSASEKIDFVNMVDAVQGAWANGNVAQMKTLGALRLNVRCSFATASVRGKRGCSEGINSPAQRVAAQLESDKEALQLLPGHEHRNRLP
jgi:hypothetical protein